MLSVVVVMGLVMATREELRDGAGRLLGWRQRSGVRIEGYDAGGRLRGWYEPKANETHDAGGRLIGRYDLLTALIIGR